uniref:Uncharacterized protein n=1 Tax=Chromera velia CCMP2878 TaxID=1169474 RepID=A0A0G4HTT3_9ALVE|eukprot:Cvel_8522.t1-p1 / transcript=Cvel_8522.t1 / gene=Cvel_8522 / organism=Chromera_velia_CCMP2878 / gene_product=hypothetical protein / transcript_product=hypothetical protein / location=Cvel_scaffold472:15626-16507(-) / protein_length=294 / sequence_SO=supercontig / SO=protein_coding / is_pseudo=false
MPFFLRSFTGVCVTLLLSASSFVNGANPGAPLLSHTASETASSLAQIGHVVHNHYFHVAPVAPVAIAPVAPVPVVAHVAQAVVPAVAIPAKQVLPVVDVSTPKVAPKDLPSIVINHGNALSGDITTPRYAVVAPGQTPTLRGVTPIVSIANSRATKVTVDAPFQGSTQVSPGVELGRGGGIVHFNPASPQYHITVKGGGNAAPPSPTPQALSNPNRLLSLLMRMKPPVKVEDPKAAMGPPRQVTLHVKVDGESAGQGTASGYGVSNVVGTERAIQFPKAGNTPVGAGVMINTGS